VKQNENRLYPLLKQLIPEFLISKDDLIPHQAYTINFNNRPLNRAILYFTPISTTYSKKSIFTESYMYPQTP
jgi:hypothetical protein